MLRKTAWSGQEKNHIAVCRREFHPCLKHTKVKKGQGHLMKSPMFEQKYPEPSTL